MRSQLVTNILRFMEPPFDKLHLCSVDKKTVVTLPFIVSEKTKVAKFEFVAEYQPGHKSTVYLYGYHEGNSHHVRNTGDFLEETTKPIKHQLGSVGVGGEPNQVCVVSKEQFETAMILGYLVASFGAARFDVLPDPAYGVIEWVGVPKIT